MGHADAKTTQIYAHYQPADDEAERVARAFAERRVDNRQGLPRRGV